MASVPNYYVPPEEYLALERKAEFKSEYMDGTVYAFAGGSPRHSLLAANIITSLSVQLRTRPCRVYSSDLKVSTPSLQRFFYPDVSVVCGETVVANEQRMSF
jgi:Uma2 family endonuclease